MKKLLLIIFIILFLTSCSKCNFEYKWICYSYDEFLEAKINDMLSPVIIIWISWEKFWWKNVTIKDWRWNILSIWNLSVLSSTLSERKIWDIIK